MMKRILPLLLCLLLLAACAGQTTGTYSNAYFSVSLPEHIEPVKNTSFTCFAPYGDPVLSSSITVSSTELNWYFDRFTAEEYGEALRSLCGYESLTVETMTVTSVDGYDARRIACKVVLEQGTHDLILYAVHADQTYFITLLNREGDSYIEAFDDMISTIHFTGAK